MFLRSERESPLLIRYKALIHSVHLTLETRPLAWVDSKSACLGSANRTRWKRVAAFATDQLYSAPRRHFASSMNNTGQKGWSYRWDETEVPNVPPELGGVSLPNSSRK